MKPTPKLAISATALAAVTSFASTPLAFAAEAKSSVSPSSSVIRLASDIQASEGKTEDTVAEELPVAEETPEPVEVVPVVPAPTPSEPVEPAPAPSESVEPAPEPSETENAPAPVTPADPSPVEEAAPVTVDEQQNILLTGIVTQERANAETGETVVVTEETTAAGEQVTTQYVVNPDQGQTTVTQSVTNPATGEKKVTERKVPATTFKAGGAASIEDVAASPRSSAASVLVVVATLGLFALVAGVLVRLRQGKTA